MDTLVDPSEQQTAYSSGRMKAEAPRTSMPSMEDAQVEWFARTGAFPAASSAPPPPTATGERLVSRDKQIAREREREPEASFLSGADLEDDDIDISLDSFVDPSEVASFDPSGFVPSNASIVDPSEVTSIHDDDEDEREADMPTRRFVRARIWTSED